MAHVRWLDRVVAGALALGVLFAALPLGFSGTDAAAPLFVVAHAGTPACLVVALLLRDRVGARPAARLVTVMAAAAASAAGLGGIAVAVAPHLPALLAASRMAMLGRLLAAAAALPALALVVAMLALLRASIRAEAHRLRALTLLTEAARTITSGPALEQALDAVVVATLRAWTDARPDRGAWAALLRVEGDQVRVRNARVSTGRLELTARPFALPGDALLRDVIRGDRTVSVLVDAVEPGDSAIVDFVRPLGVRSLTFAPIRVEGRVVGALGVAGGARRGRHPELLDLLETIAQLAGAAIANADSFHRMRQAIAELERLNRLKTDFLSIVGHEFRTALFGIQGFSELMGDDGMAASEMRVHAGDINANARRLVRLINDMLDLDRMGSAAAPLAIRPLVLNDLVQQEAIRARAMSAAHSFRLDLDLDAPAVAADEDRVAQALGNLLSNAVRYSPAGGEIVLATRVTGGEVMVSVADRGAGIPAADLERVFDRFARVDSDATRMVKGTGLGLAIVRQVAELHGGRAWAESEVGRGSTFYLTLPHHPVAAGELTTAGAAA